MNKTIQAALAGSAGIALLGGGFGTYALWHDSADVAGGGLSSGLLDVTAHAAAWTDVSPVGPNNWTPGDLIVPGDTIKMVQTFDVTATGKNLRGRLTFTPGVVDTAAFGNHLTITAAATAGAGFSAVTPGSAWTFDAAPGTRTVTATVTYAFGSDTSAQDAQSAAASIASSSFAVDQVRS